MNLGEIIEIVLKEQSNHYRPIPVDITILNGNILLRSFHIYDLNLSKNSVKGLTQQEEYAHAREDRDPVYCYLKLDEIKELSCPDLGLEYFSEMSLVRA